MAIARRFVLTNALCVKNQWREFHPVLVSDVFGFIDVLIRFWDQRSRSTVENDPKKPDEYNILIGLTNFTKIIGMVLTLCTCAMRHND